MSKNVLLLVILTVATLTASLFATESRMAAMGGMNGYVKDNTDIFTYPGTIFNYNKFVTMEMRTSGYTDGWSLGADVPLGSGILGVYFNEPTGIDIDDYFDGYHSDYMAGDLNLSRKLDILYGLKEGLGVGISLAGTAYSPYKDLKESANYVALKAGMSTDMMDTGVTIAIPMGTVENKNTKEKTTFTNFGIDLNARLYLIQKNDWSLSGLGELGFGSSTTKHKQGSEVKYASSIINLHLGLGINYNVSESTLLVFAVKPVGMSLVSTKRTPGSNKTSSSDIIIPEYKVGIESQVLSWLIIRAGATETYSMASETHTSSSSSRSDITSSSYGSIFSSEVGLGIKFGNFMLDSVINNPLLFDGPNVIGGRAPGIASKLSLGYTF